MKNAADNTPNQKSSSQQIDVAIRIGLIALLAFWSLYIAAPFIVPVIWGIIIAVGSYPLHRLLQSKLGLSNILSATLYTLLLLALLITPTVILSGALINEAQSLTTKVNKGTFTIPAPPDSVKEWPLIGKNVSDFWNKASLDPKETVRSVQPQLEIMFKWLIKTAAGAGFTILIFIFSIIIAGVFLATAAKGRRAAEAIMTRLVGENGKSMTDLAQSTVTSVVNGILGIAILQAILAGLGFMAMGIPGAGALALICLVLAVVQIDILIILIPLSIYAFSTVGVGAATMFLIWNIAVGLMNNVLKPILLGRGVKAPMAVIFIGAIGGMLAHGIIGLFIGAVVFVLGYTLFMVWLEEADTDKADITGKPSVD